MFEASGTVRGRNTAVLTSRIVAGLREVRVRAGDPVRAGQILAVLEDADAQAAADVCSRRMSHSSWRCSTVSSRARPLSLRLSGRSASSPPSR
jgi:multidrug resistance efflux pump